MHAKRTLGTAPDLAGCVRRLAEEMKVRSDFHCPLPRGRSPGPGDQTIALFVRLEESR